MELLGVSAAYRHPPAGGKCRLPSQPTPSCWGQVPLTVTLLLGMEVRIGGLDEMHHSPKRLPGVEVVPQVVVNEGLGSLQLLWRAGR